MSYVTPKPPNRKLKNAKRPFSECKVALHLNKVCYKNSLCDTVSNKFVRHSLAFLSIQKWFAGDVPYYVKINFQLINIR